MKTLLLSLLFIVLTGCRDSGNQGADINPNDEVDVPLAIRTWKVPSDFMKRLLDGPRPTVEQRWNEADPFLEKGIICKFYLQLPDMLENYYEIPFPSGTSIDFPARKLLLAGGP
jgi:hypothetical protein